MIPFLEFHSEFRRLETEIRAAIDEVFQAGWYILGKQLEAFENEFAAHLGAAHAVGVASGTDAIHLALAAAGVIRGDGVITAANTCVPTAVGIIAAGGELQLADVDPGTLTMSPQALERAITEKTKAIVPVHLYGHPCDMDAILAIAQRHGLVVVEDCAQAHGACYRERPCGRFGAAAAFSFYPSKNLGAYGDAGAIATDSDEIRGRLRRLRNYGEDRRYHHVCDGVNSRLDEIQAAILRVKLRHLDWANDARRQRAQRYHELLAGFPLRLPHEAPWATANYHLFVIRTPQRDALAEHLRERGVATLMHYPVPLHLQEVYQRLQLGPGSFPEAERAAHEVLSLPLHPDLPMEEVEQVALAVRDFFG